MKTQDVLGTILNIYNEYAELANPKKKRGRPKSELTKTREEIAKLKLLEEELIKSRKNKLSCTRHLK